jgi:O-antigen/teichoic acid export membrane protein
MQKSFLKNSVIYVGAEMLNKAIPFLLLPILTKNLSPAEYGIYGMYQVVLTFFAPLITMNLQTNITRNFFKVSKEELSKIISSLLVILHINVFVGTILIYIISVLFENPMGIPDRILYLMPIIVYVQTINTLNLTILRNREKALVYGGVQILLTSLNFGIGLFLLLVWEQGWQSLVYGALFSHIIVSIYSLVQLKKNYQLGQGLYPLKKIYAISVPLIFHLLGGSIIFLSDRIFIQQMLGLKEVGMYSVGNQFGMITMVVINALIMAVNPWIYKNLANNNQEMVKKIYWLMGVFFILGVFIWMSSVWVFPYMVDEKYLVAKNVIFWVSFAFTIRGWYQLFYNVIVHEGKTKILMFITFGAGILNLCLNYVFIVYHGMIGAAEATLVAFVVMFVAIWLYTNKVSALKWI